MRLTWLPICHPPFARRLEDPARRELPPALHRSLRAEGQDVEHIITLGLRGTSDAHIKESLFGRNVLFLTHDEDFLFDGPSEAIVVVSRVRQSRRLAERVELWTLAVLDLLRNPRPEHRFELMDDGCLLAWEEGPDRTWTSKSPRSPGRGSE